MQRLGQSSQSVPDAQYDQTDPGPPSSHSPSPAYSPRPSLPPPPPHVFMQQKSGSRGGGEGGGGDGGGDGGGSGGGGGTMHRLGQSPQSEPRRHHAPVEPMPPSSQTPSRAKAQVVVQHSPGRAATSLPSRSAPAVSAGAGRIC